MTDASAASPPSVTAEQSAPMDVHERIVSLRVDMANLRDLPAVISTPYALIIMLVDEISHALPISPKSSVSRDQMFKEILSIVAPGEYPAHVLKSIPIEKLLPSRKAPQPSPPPQPLAVKCATQYVEYPDGTMHPALPSIKRLKDAEIRILQEKAAELNQPIPKIPLPRIGIKHRPDIVAQKDDDQREPRVAEKPILEGETANVERYQEQPHLQGKLNPQSPTAVKRKRSSDDDNEDAAIGAGDSSSERGSSPISERPIKKSRSISPTVPPAPPASLASSSNNPDSESPGRIRIHRRRRVSSASSSGTFYTGLPSPRSRSASPPPESPSAHRSQCCRRN